MTIEQRKLQISEVAMGPAFFIFFRVKTIVIPPSAGGSSSSSLAVVTDDEDLDTIEVEDQADLDNKDLSDILTLLKMAEIIE